MTEEKKEVKGKCFLVGFGSFVKNPNAPPPPDASRAYPVGSIKSFEFESVEMATELAGQLAEKNPGTFYHVVQTVTVFGAEVQPAQRLSFVNA